MAETWAPTARYHRVEVAEEAGHQLGYIAPFLLDHCIAKTPPRARWATTGSTTTRSTTSASTRCGPRAGLRAGPNGQLNLVAVEWIVPAAAWHAAGNTEPPSVLGHEMHVLNPALGWYILHAWVWKHNPAGMFEDWNPEVVCP